MIVFPAMALALLVVAHPDSILEVRMDGTNIQERVQTLGSTLDGLVLVGRSAVQPAGVVDVDLAGGVI